MAHELPTIRLKGTAYIIDLAGRQFRETMDRENRIDFDSVAGVEFCRQAGVVTCLHCGMSVIAAVSDSEDTLWCMRCRGRIGR